MKSKSALQLVRADSRRLAICLATLLAAEPAHAASATWTGATNALWATNTNWSGPPALVPGSGDTATFNAALGSGGATINLGPGVTIQQLTFDSASAAAYTIGSGGAGAQTLTFNAGGMTMTNTVANNELCNASVVLGTANGDQAYTFTNNSLTKSLTLDGGISSSTAGIKTLTVAGAGPSGIGGALTNGSGTLALVKSDGGVLTLAGANAHTGSTTARKNSTIRSGADNVLSDASTLIVAAGTIDLNDHDDTVGTGGTAIFFYTTNGEFNLTNTVSTGTGTLTLGGNIGVDSDARTTVNLISGKLDLGSATRSVNNPWSSPASTPTGATPWSMSAPCKAVPTTWCPMT
ncbi:MAG: hypothetical protein NTW21_10365 [Verrucomicrobia bacterium]|nr:hypothetical protein [Verrucomicrobiota bacterium]